MINAVIDSVLSQGENENNLLLVLDIFSRLRKYWPENQPIQVQLSNNYPKKTLQRLQELFKSAGWPDESIKLHHWSPVLGLKLHHPINQILRSYTAAWNGAHVDLHLTLWAPCYSTKAAIPQALCIFNTLEPKTFGDKIKKKLEKTIILNNINKYGIVGVEPQTSLFKELIKERSKVVSMFDLYEALATAPKHLAPKAKSLAWVSNSDRGDKNSSLLTGLKEYYDVTLITNKPELMKNEKCTEKWLIENGRCFDRLCYEVTDLSMQTQALKCLELWPGIINLIEAEATETQHKDNTSAQTHVPDLRELNKRELYEKYGYPSLGNSQNHCKKIKDFNQEYSEAETLFKSSIGLILHSREADKALKKDHNSNNIELIVDGSKDCYAMAKAYRDSIENLYSNQIGCKQQAIRSIASRTQKSHLWDKRIAIAIDESMPTRRRKCQRHLLVDVTQIALQDLKTGIQRVVRSIVLEWIKNYNEALRIEPVYLTAEGGEWHYRYARKWTLGLINETIDELEDLKVEVEPGDQMLLLDLNPFLINAHQKGALKLLSDQGLTFNTVVYDIIPILLPNVFPEGAKENHSLWLHTVAEVSKKLICISKAVSKETHQYLQANKKAYKMPDITWFHLGADITISSTSRGWYERHDELEQRLSNTISFLMVGTIEPRKGHLKALRAVQLLLDKGAEITLIIVGKEGWMVDETINALRSNANTGCAVHWLDGISDEYLDYLYRSCDCLIAASEGEGYGLPLIEAAIHNLPIFARDLPVFREVAKDAAFYFQGDSPHGLAEALNHWMLLFSKNNHPKSEKIEWLNWEESSRQLMQHLTS